jgi:hypothetical protein
MIGLLRAVLAMDRRTGYRFQICHLNTKPSPKGDIEQKSGHKKNPA